MDNNRGSNKPPLLLHQIFEQQVAKTPLRIAVEHIQDKVQVTYEELNQFANGLAATLVDNGVKPGHIVAVHLPRSIHQYVAILAILKAGAAYLPIDPETPSERVSYILHDSGACVALTSDELWRAEFSQLCTPIFLPSRFRQFKIFLSDASENRAPVTSEDDLCYVIYTSGTSGFPKGVGISHKNARTFVNAIRQVYGVEQTDRVLQGFSIAFDASVEEIWLAFSVGATLVVGTLECMRILDELPDRLKEFEITVFSTVPTVLRMMPKRDIPTLRLLIVGGEAAHPDIIEKWSVPSRKLLNGYGPTECTVTATYAWCLPGALVTIGKPLPGYEAAVLDEQLHQVPDGTEGELCLFGPAVSSRGYLNHAELSAQKFVDCDGRRGYRTGDLVYRNENGDLVYRGRIDSQVKIRGFRVELEEIEAHLNRLNHCEGAVAGLYEDPLGSTQLVAYMLQSERLEFDIQDAVATLCRHLPAYMIPSQFVSLRPSALPRLNSGKIDRKRLPPPSQCERLGTQEALELNKVKPNGDLDSVTAKLLSIWQDVLCKPVRLEDSFFDLGCHSLFAAQVISRCRQDEELSVLGIRDVYEHKSIGGLVSKISELKADRADLNADAGSLNNQRTARDRKTKNIPPADHRDTVRASPICYGAVVLLQSMTLIGITAAYSYLLYGAYWLEQNFVARSPHTHGVGLFIIATFLPIIVLLLSAAVGLLLKWLVVGRFKEADLPLWSLGYFKWWLTNLCLGPISALSSLLVGTPFAPSLYRLLGARVGKGVYIGSPLSEAELITIEDGASIGVGVTLRSHRIENGHLKLRQVHIGRNVFVGAQSIVGGGARLGDRSRIHPLTSIAHESSIPAGTEWRGSPAKQVIGSDLAFTNLLNAHKRQSPGIDCRHPWQAFGKIGSLQIIFLIALEVALFLPVVLEILLFQNVQIFSLALQVLDLKTLLPASVLFSALRFSSILFTVITLKWLLAGRTYSGTILLNSVPYARAWFSGVLMTLLVGPLGTRGITETVFMPWVCRLLGMRVGKGSEISDALMLQPDLVKLGDYCMLADRCCLGPPVVYDGMVSFGPVEIGSRSFIGNVAHVPFTTTKIDDDCLIGVRSIAPDHVAAHSLWLGSPPIQLPRRNFVSPPAERTTHPSLGLVLARSFCNLWKMILPGALVEMVFWIAVTYGNSVSSNADLADLLVSLPLLLLGASVLLLTFPILAKWLSVWKYQPGQRYLWSWWMWRLEIAYEIELLVLGIFGPILAGTPYLPLWYRAMGARIGHRACLIEASLMEPDLIRIGDDVSIEGALQTHLFEDRVMKLDTVNIEDRCSIGREATVLYGSEMRANSHLGDLSLIINHETFLENRSYHGLPAQTTAPAEVITIKKTA